MREDHKGQNNQIHDVFLIYEDGIKPFLIIMSLQQRIATTVRRRGRTYDIPLCTITGDEGN